MKLPATKRSLSLLIGDVCIFLLSLWGALALRYVEPPSAGLFLLHLRPFAILFIVSVLVFYIAGLYGRQTTILRSRLPALLANAQIANSIVAVIFFYLKICYF